MTAEYTQITPELVTDQSDSKPVHIQYGDVKLDLPRLDDSRHVPLAVLTVGMTAISRGWDNLDEDEKIGLLSVLLAYLTREYPRLERELDRKSGDKIKDVGRIIDAWAKASSTDPKS
ncbi:hypothetical protein EMO92_08225 [Bifidobacterium reuteri]|uniref:Uncharacterized protein n=2 Tax=Bifidobacterium reuteri TaxID=983706 RepID=A0A087CSF8_9BIFI|nr:MULTISPECIES: hypothetical protein [Bifidobacterium]KAA8824883.1 hypothetical protein EMO92_08225 [Bifidobacterium reuteri]KFI86208.1 hypothetical protein BREU_1377 [Bifidobacterium reuteri DSM 23975]TPF78350.1 hypothetical protein BW09_04665 [Bifidobacterium sp. UTCIF-1]TPF81229.1 hypothetical protein BW08_00915 [Bifidobacterium sp. UTCIF-24]TPF82010.1 hypothetical protein BW12_07080 [Bifidobacterium sp. UTCIF-3]